MLSLLTTDHVRFGVTTGEYVGGWIVARGDRPIRTNELVAGLSVREVLQVDSEGRFEIRSARYTLTDSASGLEIFAYHNHPPDVAFTHLHMGAGAGSLIDPVHRAHFPALTTGLEDIVIMLIRDFRVRPRRRGWEQEMARFL